MTILLDKCVPKDLRKSLVDHKCQTAPKAGFAGKKNGELLTLAERDGFDVLLTTDKSLSYQQNLKGRTISLLIVRAKSNKLADLLPYIPASLEALRSIKPGQVIRIGG